MGFGLPGTRGPAKDAEKETPTFLILDTRLKRDGWRHVPSGEKNEYLVNQDLPLAPPLLQENPEV